MNIYSYSINLLGCRLLLYKDRFRAILQIVNILYSMWLCVSNINLVLIISNGKWWCDFVYIVQLSPLIKIFCVLFGKILLLQNPRNQALHRVALMLWQCVPERKSLDVSSLGWCVPWTMRPLDDASLGRWVPCMVKGEARKYCTIQV